MTTTYSELPQQTKAKDKLSKVKVGAFFMEAGTGKTRPVVEIVRSIRPDFVLYIAPLRTIKAKRDEGVTHQVDMWGGFGCHTMFLGVESISQSDRIYLEAYNGIKSARRPVIIVDESLKIKNAEAKRTKRVIELGKMCEYKYILNGTPLSKNLLDLWSQMEFLSPSILRMRQAEFKNYFCEYKKITIRKHGTYRERSREWIIQYHNLDYLYALIEPFIYECDLALPVGLSFIDVPYELSDDEKAEHKRIMEEVLSEDWLLAKPNFFLMLTQKLQHNYSMSPEKLELVDEIIERHPDALIVAKYIDTQEVLAKRYSSSRVLSWQRDAFGLNLQDHNKMILFDQHWDYALFDQIVRRIYRTNQSEDCTVWRLVGNVGLERMMYDNVVKKGDMLTEFKRMNTEQLSIELK